MQCVGSFIEVDNCVDLVRQDSYSPLVYSYDLQCFNCNDSRYNWVKYVTAALVPLTVFAVCGVNIIDYMYNHPFLDDVSLLSS